MTVGVVLLALGAAVAIRGGLLAWLYREGETADRSTIIGGRWLGAVWATRLGPVAAAVGAFLLVVAAVP